MKHIDKETFNKVHTASENLLLGDTKEAYRLLNEIVNDKQLSLCSVSRSATDIDKINKRFEDCEELLTKFDGKDFMVLVLAATYIGESYAYNK